MKYEISPMIILSPNFGSIYLKQTKYVFFVDYINLD